MELNADFTRRAAVHAASLPWQPSPTPGVDRRMLDRIGDEVARATSIVRYAPNSRFPAHTHGGGEEFLVLDGVFQDEAWRLPCRLLRPQSAQVRGIRRARRRAAPSSSSSGSSTPATAPRCAWCRTASPIAPVPDRPGVEAAQLFKDAVEDVRLERWAPDADIALRPTAAWNYWCSTGASPRTARTFVAQSWLRLPAGDAATVSVGRDGCRLWIKEGHLAPR